MAQFGFSDSVDPFARIRWRTLRSRGQHTRENSLS